MSFLEAVDTSYLHGALRHWHGSPRSVQYLMVLQSEGRVPTYLGSSSVPQVSHTDASDLALSQSWAF